MINIDNRYLKQTDETDYEHGLRLITIKVEENPSDLDWEDIVSILGLNCHRDSLRKAAATTEYSGYKVMQYFKDKYASGEKIDYADELDKRKRSLAEERYKLQTEKQEYNRWLRENARDDLFEEKVLATIRDSLNSVDIPDPIIPTVNNREAVLCIADCHFGKDFTIYGVDNSIINTYNPDIFYMRMTELLNEVVAYGEKERIDKLKVFNLGDSLDGFLRHSQAWSLRYGVVESAIMFSEYMGKWLNRLSNYFDIEYYQTCGNHGELRLLDGLKNQHSNENIEMIVGHIIKMINEDNPNFTYVENKSGFIFTSVGGFNIMGVHRDVKSPLTAIKDYSTIYGVPVDYLICGHKHHAEYNSCGARKGVIGVGSIMGSDDYAIKTVMKTSDATASLVVFESMKGKVDEHTFVLN